MHFASTARIVYGTILATSIAVCSEFPTHQAQAATTLIDDPSALRQAMSTLHGPTRPFTLVDSSASSTGDVIVSASQGVYVYSNTLKPVTEINVQVGQPTGLALDTAGDLYIANGGTSGIPVYKNDYKTLIATLSDPNPSQGIAVAPSGVVGVVESYPPNVTFYASGSTTPCTSLSLPSVHGLYQGTFDAAGDFYITGQNPSYNGFVGVIRGGCSATGLTVLSTANSLGEYVYGIQITRFGKIAIESQSNRAIYTYNNPVNGSLGQPIATTPLPTMINSAYQFGFTAKGSFVLVSSDSGIVAKLAYPAGGKVLQSFGPKQELNNPIGLVVAPPA